ncbi:uncharacterized protein [Venturia canescens]|uniref:uncharacterized protein isoform X3 n=1 Tax=Venturia canescens TaxID=32260 RepID=UPI001C9D04E2|nr:uncharacterized protein LOC122409807 isoform X3 [Venturia canescens]
MCCTSTQDKKRGKKAPRHLSFEKNSCRRQVSAFADPILTIVGFQFNNKGQHGGLVRRMYKMTLVKRFFYARIYESNGGSAVVKRVFGLTVFLIPLTALAYTYARICYGIWNKDGEIAKFARRDNGGDIGAGTCTERNRQPFVSRARLRTARQTVTVVSLYAITSSPFIGCQLWAAWDPNAASSPFFTGQSYAPLFIFYSLKVIHTNTTNFRCNFYDSLSTEQPHQFCESLDLSRFRSRAPCDTRGFFEEKCWIEKFCRSRCVVERLTRSGRSLDEKLAFPANRNKIQLLEQRSIGPNKGGTTTYQLRSFLNVLFFRVSTTFPTKCLFL